MKAPGERSYEVFRESMHHFMSASNVRDRYPEWNGLQPSDHFAWAAVEQIATNIAEEAVRARRFDRGLTGFFAYIDGEIEQYRMKWQKELAKEAKPPEPTRADRIRDAIRELANLLKEEGE